MMDLKTLSSDELNTLLSDVKSELDARAAVPQTITVRVAWDSYNERRYSRPWIAVIAQWSIAGKAEMTWGSYLGTSQGGQCEVACKIGDVIRYGQKDLRGSSTFSSYAIVLSADDLLAVSEATASAYHRADADKRAEMIGRWISVRAEKIALMSQRDALLDTWRADTNNRIPYNAADKLDRAAKALTYSA